MTEPEKRARLETDPDFILLKRFDFSLAAALRRYEDGMPTPLIAQALGITDADVERRYQRIVGTLREALGE
jgi:hypothetical protein